MLYLYLVQTPKPTLVCSADTKSITYVILGHRLRPIFTRVLRYRETVLPGNGRLGADAYAEIVKE